jgi:hypothetical protein
VLLVERDRVLPQTEKTVLWGEIFIGKLSHGNRDRIPVSTGYRAAWANSS